MNPKERQTSTTAQHHATAAQHYAAERPWPLHLLCWAAALAFVLMLFFSALTISWQHVFVYDLLLSVFFSGAMIGCYLLISPRHRPIGTTLALGGCNTGSLLRFALGPGLLALLLAIIYGNWRIDQLSTAQQVGETVSLTSVVCMLLLLVVIGPLLEEILYRQLVLQTLVQKLRSIWPATVFGALLFAGSHSLSTEQQLWSGIQLHQLLLFLVALVLTWVRLRYHSIWQAVILHGAYNLGIGLTSLNLAS